jgi:hypothetical protein
MKFAVQILFFFVALKVSALSMLVQRDSLKWRTLHPGFRNFRTPALLIGGGLIAATDNEVLDNSEINKLRNRIAPNFHTHIDNYLQYAPVAAVYGLGMMGIKGKNDFANKTAILVKSELLMSVAVYGLKHATSADRPGTETETAFPSGHTAQAFVAATFLHKEYGEDHPWISVAGYVAASGVGVLRILNNKHWVSDVLVGAGIGILSTNIVYATHRYSWGKRKTKSMATILPTYQRGAAGLYVSIPVH